MKKKIILTTFSLIVATFLVSLFVSNDNKEVKAYEKTTDLFCNAKNMTLKENYYLPDSFMDSNGNEIARDFDDDMKDGVLISSYTSGSSVELAPLFSGDFEIKMRPYSDISDYTLKFNDATTDINKYCDLKEIKLTFEDINNNKFDVYIKGGEKYNIVTPAARVAINDSALGYHYEKDATEPSNTSYKNSIGYYTRIPGTTFGNVAYTGAKLTSSDSKPLTIGYNADTMEIYTYTYGTNNRYEDGIYRIIAKLNSDDFGLNKIDSFSDYKVTISFSDIKENKMAKVLIYSINGQSLDGNKITNDYGPLTSFSFNHAALINSKYYLPTPNNFDILDNNNIKTKIKITSGNKTYPLYDKNNNLITDDFYQEGCYFIPLNTGKISVSYLAYDSDNIAGKEKIKELEVLESLGIINYKFNNLDKNYLANTNRGLNSILNIIPTIIECNIFDEKTYANVSLYLNGEIFNGIKEQKITQNMPVILDKIGTYKLVYSIDDYYNEDMSYTFNVDDVTPLLQLATDIDSTYAYNSTFKVPSATINNKKASYTLYDPDGTLLTSSSSYSLDKIGTYNLTYMVRIDNKVYQYKYYFNVSYSSLNLFSCEDGITCSYGNTGNLFAYKQNGQLITSTITNKKATFNQILDLTSNTKDDILLQFITIPSKISFFDAYQYRFTLQDIYDESNYVDIILYKGSWGNAYSYVRVGASNQIPCGLEMGKVLSNYNAGTPVNYSMSGDNISGCEKFTLYYDCLEKAFYVDNIKRPGYSYGNLIIDLDDPAYFSETKLWNGFTTNEVKLTVSIEMLQESSASLLFTNINGVSYDNLFLEDEKAPTININTLEYDEAYLPYGCVNTKYPLFKATSFDNLDGKIDVNIKVYKNYQTLNQEEISIKDNYFIPDEKGTYTILYYVTDKAGNYFSKYLSVEVQDTIDKLDYVLVDSLPNSSYVGKYLTMSQGTIIGGSGTTSLKIEVKKPDNSIYELDLNNKTIYFDTKGKYQIIFTLKDFLDNKEIITHDIDVTISSSPIVNDFTYNDTLIAGYSYDLSSFKAYDYNNNAEASYSYEIIQNGITTKLDSSIYVPEATSNQEEVTLRFIATSVDKKSQTVEEINAHILKVVTGKTVNLSNLFYQEKISEVILNDNDVTYYTNENNAKLVYANYLIANGLETSYKVDASNNNFDKIVVVMQDMQNINQKVTYTICKTEASLSSSKVIFNDNNEYDVTGDFYNNTTYGFNIRYNENSNSIIDTNTNILIGRFNEYDNGNTFKGFSSGLVKISFSLEDVTGKSGIMMQAIANQSISNDIKDRTDPLINIQGTLASNPLINEVLIVPAAIVADAIDPNAKVSVLISNDDGIIYEGDISSDYQFIPTKYGKYTISYIATDINKRTKTLPYVITVKDRIAPTLTLSENPKETFKLGNSYELPHAVVNDNNDTNLAVYLYIETPEGELRLNANDDYSFNPKLKGYYTIIYYAEDSYYNYVMEQYVVYVG